MTTSGEPGPQPTAYDDVIQDIAEYCLASRLVQDVTQAAHLSFVDTLACALLATAEPDARALLEPPYAAMPAPGSGARVVGTAIRASVVDAAFATGALVRWLDFNDTWLAQEWGHPSDCLGALLPLCDHLATPTVTDLLRAMAQCYEIQGSLSVHTALNRHGLDHTAFVRVATAAVAARLLGGSHAQVADAVAHAFTDGGPLRAYRHAPNVTWRKSWAAGDAAARGLWLADHARRLPDAPHTPLTAPDWGLQDALLEHDRVTLDPPLRRRVIDAVLLKPAYPAEYHGQSAVEAALTLHPHVPNPDDQITRIEVRTCEAAVRIIDKQGPLHGHADRDHCLQYMVAVALLHGRLTAQDYDDDVADDPRIDRLRDMMQVVEDPEYTRAYLDPARRAVPTHLTVHRRDRPPLAAEVVYPLGHPRRRSEARPHVASKLRKALALLPGIDAARVGDTLMDLSVLRDLPVRTVLDLLTPRVTRP